MTIKEILLMADDFVRSKLVRIADNQRNYDNMTEYEQHITDIENKRLARDIRCYINSVLHTEE